MFDDLAAHYRSWGLKVYEEPGWQDRGHGRATPRAFVAHHDAIEARWSGRPPSIFRAGRPDLPGPITNVTLDSTGRVGMIAAGVAYHAGTGSWNGLSGGNTVTWGCEAQNGGTGQEWPAAQIAAYVLLAAASCDYFGFSSSMVCRHAEWAGSRKIDAWGPWAGTPYRWELHADRFRMLVAQASPDAFDWDAVLAAIANQQEDDPMFVLKVKNAPGPATLVSVDGATLPLLSTAAWRALAERYPLVEVSRSDYNRQLAAAVPFWRRVLRTRDA